MPDKVTTVASIAKVTLFPLAVLLIPTPPSNPKVSLSKSIAMVVLPSLISKSCKVTCASTYAFILCCVDNAVAEFESMPSSSSIVVTVAPLSPNCKLNSFCVSCLPSVVSFAVHLTLALSYISKAPLLLAPAVSWLIPLAIMALGPARPCVPTVVTVMPLVSVIVIWFTVLTLVIVMLSTELMLLCFSWYYKCLLWFLLLHQHHLWSLNQIHHHQVWDCLYL